MKKILLLFLTIIVVGIISAKPYFSFVSQTMGVSLVKLLLPIDTIAKTNDQVNILVLGIGGGKHDGPNLSDSIIIANYNFQTNRLTTVGVPRDIWIQPLHDKINSAFAYGTAKGDTKSGLKLAKGAVETVFQQPIHYAVVIDFDKFEKIIDYVGGIDIKVERSFTDSKFPIAGKENDTCGGDTEYKCRYEEVSFDKGMQHMNGERALTFVRSRYGNNGEGSDFARSQRQQLVFTELKDKLTQVLMSGNVNKISELYKLLNESLIRDITNQQITELAKNIVLKRHFSQKNDFLPESLFEVPDASSYDGKYVLIPKDNDSHLLGNYFACIISDQDSCKVI